MSEPRAAIGGTISRSWRSSTSVSRATSTLAAISVCDVAFVSSSVLDELLVAEDVALGVRELLEQVVLELLQLDLVVSFCCSITSRALLLEVGPLLRDDQREQLLLEALLGDGEVDDRRLRLHLGDVVRVRQLRLQVELEERLVGRSAVSSSFSHDVDLLVAELARACPLTIVARASTGVEDGVDGRRRRSRAASAAPPPSRARACRGSVFCEQLRVSARSAPRGLDPRDALQLRVDDQRPARAHDDDDRAFCVESGRRAAPRAPARHRASSSRGASGSSPPSSGCRGRAASPIHVSRRAAAPRNSRVEGADVRDERAASITSPTSSSLRLASCSTLLAPARSRPPRPLTSRFGEVEPLRRALGLPRSARFFSSVAVDELILQLGPCAPRRPPSRAPPRASCWPPPACASACCSSFALRLDVEVDVVVDAHVDDPVAEPGGRRPTST